jgi:DNA-binding LacI/PurR family transcriptional regulator
MPKQSLLDVDRVYRHCLQVIESSPKVPLPLESEWTLANRFAVSRRVARQALQQLVREGRAVCHAGKGYASRPTSELTQTKRLKVGIVHHPPRRVYAGVRHSVLTQLCQSLEAHEFTSGAIPIETPETGPPTQRSLAEFEVDAYLLCSVSPATQAFFASQKKPTVVLGNTIRELGLASVYLDELEIVRQVTEQLLTSGHQQIALLQEKTFNLGSERQRIGFLYAHHAQLARFHPDRIVRVDREKKGMSQELLQLFKMAPTAILLDSVPLWELIWSRASAAMQKYLAATETVVLAPDFSGMLRHPAKVVDFDPQWESEAAIKLLEDCLRGRTKAPRHMSIPWKLVDSMASTRRGRTNSIA